MSAPNWQEIREGFRSFGRSGRVVGDSIGSFVIDAVIMLAAFAVFAICLAFVVACGAVILAVFKWAFQTLAH